MKTHRIALLTLLAVILIATPTFTAEIGAQGVSPGAPDRVARISGTCPTFNWEAAPGVGHYDLVVYRLSADEVDVSAVDLSTATEVLYIAVPGGATGWTPESAACFDPGERYAWFVRAVMDAEVGEESDWSPARFFEVASAPSFDELERAIEVLRRWEAATGNGSPMPASAAAPDAVTASATVPAAAAAPDSGTGSGSNHPKSVTTGTAAIRGEQPDPSGETYGVVGTSASPNGAGIGAANTAGGPDLVLDGAVPTEFSESGIDRSSASPQTFSFTNTGGGGMMLDLEGVPVVTTATDQDTVGALTCGSGQLAKWNGATWVCALDLDTDTLASLSCATWQIPKWNGSIWECNYDWDTLYNLGCNSGEIPKHDGSAWFCAEDEDTTYSLGPGLILDGGQIRIDPAEFTTQITTIEIAGAVDPDHLSLAVGADGLGLIAYYDSAAQLLRVLHCLNPTCTGVEVNTPDITPGAGMYPSIAIGTDGLAVISYWGGPTTDNLKVAHCDDLRCSTATISGVSGQCGKHSSIAIGSDSFPLIAYASDYNGFEVAHCLDTECTYWDYGLPLYTGIGCMSLTIGEDGYGLIVLFDSASTLAGRYRLVHCNNLNCSASTFTYLSSNSDDRYDPVCSATIGDDGLGLIAYRDTGYSGIRMVRCANALCSSPTNTLLVQGKYPSLIRGSNQRGLLAYTDFDGHLHVIRCIDRQCVNSTLTQIDSISSGNTSTAIGPGGRVLVAFVDGSTLNVARLPVGY